MQLTEEYKIFLKKHYLVNKLSIYKVGSLLNKHPSTVRKHLLQLNWLRKPCQKHPKLTKKYLYFEYIKNKKSTTEISKELKISNRTVSKWLAIYGIKARNFSGSESRVYKKPDLSIFNPLTKDAAYFLGFFAADGHFEDSYGIHRIVFELQKKDVPILEDIKKVLNIDNVIKYKQPRNNKIYLPNGRVTYAYGKGTVLLKISDIRLTNIIKKYNLYNKKKNRYSISKNIPDNLIRHFIRGFFDGDGSISHTNTRLYPKVTFTSCNLSFLKEIYTFFSKYNFTYKKYTKPNYNCYNLTINVNQTNIKLFYKILYNNSNLCLKRKKLKFEKILKDLK